MDAADISPITITANAVEYVYKKVNVTKYSSALSPEKQKKFEEMMKQDFYKDDPYRDMWDPNWIYKK
jgi:hypothetical protein